MNSKILGPSVPKAPATAVATLNETATLTEQETLNGLRSFETNMKQIEENPGTFTPYAEPKSVETLVVMMTEAEARANIQKINDLVGSVGKLLVDLKEREGWKALGYHTWTECLNQEFNESRSYLYKLMAGEEVRRDMSPIGDIEASKIPKVSFRR
jgi:hypothetical protein